MQTTTLIAAVNTLAEATGAKHRYVSWCTYCVNELDPNWELPARLAPANAKCSHCGDPIRESMGGCCLVLVPNTHPAVAS